MTGKLKLADLFNAHKQELYDALNSTNVLNENKKANKITREFFENLLREDGEYRMCLTAYEDYVLQGALSISPFIQSCGLSEEMIDENSSAENGLCASYLPLGGTVLGGAGAIAFGGIATLLGAILGTAAVIYFSNERDKNKNLFNRDKNNAANIDGYVDLIEKTCERIDEFMEVVRTQFKKIENSYENREEKTLSNTYPFLVDALKDLIVESRKEKCTKEMLISQIEIVNNNLKEYGVNA